MFKDHPWLGVGLFQNQVKIQNYHYKVQDRQGMVGHAHNNYIQVLVGVGVFGFLFYMWFCIKSYIDVFKGYIISKQRGAYSGYLLGGIGALTSFYISGLTESNFFDGEVTHMYVFVLAVLFSFRHDLKSKEQL